MINKLSALRFNGFIAHIRVDAQLTTLCNKVIFDLNQCLTNS